MSSSPKKGIERQGLDGDFALKEAKKFMFSMTRDEDAAHVIADTARQVVNSVLHREKAD